MYCTHCGSECKEDARFCSKCGQPIGYRSVNPPPPETPVRPTYNNTVPQPNFAVVKHRTPKWPFVILGVAGTIFIIVIVCFVIGIMRSPADKKTYGTLPSTAAKNTSIEKEELVGTWKAVLRIDDLLRLAMDSNADKPQQTEAMIKLLKNIKSNIELPVYYCFEEDGSSAMIMSENEWLPAVKKMVFDMLDYMKNGGFYEAIEATTGHTKEEIEEQLSAGKMTLEQYLDKVKSMYESMPEAMWKQAFINSEKFKEYKIDGYYLLETGVDTYELTKNEIIFSKKDSSTLRRSPYSFENGKLTLKAKLFTDTDDYYNLVLQKTNLQ